MTTLLQAFTGMNKYRLPPRAELANKVLIALHLLSAGVLAWEAGDFSPGVLAKAAAALALVAGLMLRLPLAYLLILVACCLGIVVALNSYDIGALAASSLQLAIALYVRKNLHVLREDVREGEPPPSPSAG